MFAIIALQSTLASLDNEKDDILPEKSNAPVEFANKIMRELDLLVTKVEKAHHTPKAQPESAVQVESNVQEDLELETFEMEEPTAGNTDTNAATTPPQDEYKTSLVQAARANITAAALMTQLTTAAQA